MLLDLDGFKYVNDSLGHSVGDQLLSDVATRLNAATGPRDFVARPAGHEFAVFLSNCADPLRLDQLASQIIEALRDASDVEQLLSSADLALYSAKNSGGGARTFFARAMQDKSEAKHRLSTDLRQALANGEFELWYQPQVCLADGSLSGVEALLRWRHPHHDLLTPQVFLQVLEDSAIAEDVCNWIVDKLVSTRPSGSLPGSHGCEWELTSSQPNFAPGASMMSCPPRCRSMGDLLKFELEITAVANRDLKNALPLISFAGCLQLPDVGYY